MHLIGLAVIAGLVIVGMLKIENYIERKLELSYRPITTAECVGSFMFMLCMVLFLTGVLIYQYDAPKKQVIQITHLVPLDDKKMYQKIDSYRVLVRTKTGQLKVFWVEDILPDYSGKPGRMSVWSVTNTEFENPVVAAILGTPLLPTEHRLAIDSRIINN